MDRPEEADESVNPREQGLSSSQPSESNVPNEPNKALLRIWQDMARVLDRLHESIKSYLTPATSLQRVTFLSIGTRRYESRKTLIK